MSEAEELRKENRDLKSQLGMAHLQIARLKERIHGTPLYEGWTTADAPRVSIDATSGLPTHWHITLNEYHRANLLWLMCDLVGYPGEGRGVRPFTFANTGDWNGEIPNMLRADHSVALTYPPNKSVEEVRQQVAFWKASDGR